MIVVAHPELVAAWIADAASGVVAVIGVLLALLTRRDERETARQLQVLQSRLDERRDERAARRDYEYEARKRLYRRCEPRLFALLEHAKEALYRTFSLARSAREGVLHGPSSWLRSPNSYYLRSTVHRLFAPLVEVRLLQRDLTLVDLRLDDRLRRAYELGKLLVRVPSAPYELAEQAPSIPYSPDWGASPSDPAFPQGLVVGDLESVLDAMIVDTRRGSRCMTFGEFDRACTQESTAGDGPLTIALALFREFSPEDRPVLWRIVVAEATVCRTILGLRDEPGAPPAAPSPPAPLALTPADIDRLALDGSAAHLTPESVEAARRFLARLAMRE